MFEGWFSKSLKEYFAEHGSEYEDEQYFVHYFLWPYLSIINGYGAALMGETTVGDLIPFFAKIPLPPRASGSVSVPGRAGTLHLRRGHVGAGHGFGGREPVHPHHHHQATARSPPSTPTPIQVTPCT